MNLNKAMWEKGDFTEIAAFVNLEKQSLSHSRSRPRCGFWT
jgi:hypothetical protein